MGLGGLYRAWEYGEGARCRLGSFLGVWEPVELRGQWNVRQSLGDVGWGGSGGGPGLCSGEHGAEGRSGGCSRAWRGSEQGMGWQGLGVQGLGVEFWAPSGVRELPELCQERHSSW